MAGRCRFSFFLSFFLSVFFFFLSSFSVSHHHHHHHRHQLTTMFKTIFFVLGIQITSFLEYHSGLSVMGQISVECTNWSPSAEAPPPPAAPSSGGLRSRNSQ